MEQDNEVLFGFEPVYDEHCKVLILGSMPSVVSLEKSFYYMHPSNRFWKIIGLLTESEIPEGIDERKALVLRNHIALWDVIGSCQRKGSLDSSIKNPIINDLFCIPNITQIKIFTNGGLASKLFKKHFQQLEATMLPSTSAANAGRFDISKWMEIKKYL